MHESLTMAKCETYQSLTMYCLQVVQYSFSKQILMVLSRVCSIFECGSVVNIRTCYSARCINCLQCIVCELYHIKTWKSNASQIAIKCESNSNQITIKCFWHLISIWFSLLHLIFQPHLISIWSVFELHLIGLVVFDCHLIWSMFDVHLMLWAFDLYLITKAHLICIW